MPPKTKIYNKMSDELFEMKTNNDNIELLSFKKNEHFTISIFKTIVSYVCLLTKFLIKISGVYLFWIGLHYIASHLYIHFCVPSNFFGFLISPFMTASPHCQGLRWIIYTGANTINNMWVILGTWLCSYLLSLKTNNDDQTD